MLTKSSKEGRMSMTSPSAKNIVSTVPRRREEADGYFLLFVFPVKIDSFIAY
jgi:hypothetical protein